MFVLLAGKAGERKTFECPIYALSIYSMLLLLLAQYKHLDSKLLASLTQKCLVWQAILLVKLPQEKWACDFHDDALPLSFQLQVAEVFF